MILQHITTGRLLAFIKKAAGKAVTDATAAATAKSEPKLRFDPTPVYAVTLAEDTGDLFSGAPYEIDLDESYPMIMVKLTPVLDADSRSFLMTVTMDDNGTSKGYHKILSLPNAGTGTWLIKNSSGLIEIISWKAASGGTGIGNNPLAISAPANGLNFAPRDSGVSSVSLSGVSSSATMLAGTTITVYAAKEV